MRIRILLTLLVSLLLSGCSKSESEIDSITGMPKVFCGPILEAMTSANNEFEQFIKLRNSVEDVGKAYFEVANTVELAKPLSSGLASKWLSEVNEVSKWFLNLYVASQEIDIEDLPKMASDWKYQFSRKELFCG